MKTLPRRFQMTGRQAAAVALASALAMLAWLTPAVAVPGWTEVPAEQVTVDPQVNAMIDDGGRADVWVVLDDSADLSGAAGIDDWAARGEYVVDRLRDTAARSQRDVLSWLTAAGVEHEPYWVINAVLVRDAGEQVVDRLATTTGVTEIRATETVSLPPVTPSEPAAAETAATVEWGVAATRAPEVWDTFGVRGENIVVGSVDSGVDFDHPALAEQYRGRQQDGTVVHDHSWYDPSGACGAAGAPPCDNTGHGTHTVGTMVGDDSAGNGIGVAPGARWIAAKGCESNSCTDTSLVAAGQWMLAPTAADGSDPRPDLRPHVVNNSWGSPSATGYYSQVVDAWVAAGIVPVFSAGNDGPGCSTHGEPGSLPQAYSVAAYDEAGSIAPFSSRGPSPQGGGGKPDIAAPGVAVRSSGPGGIYWYLDGTSMAAPHVTGAVALLLSAAPELIGDVTATRELLDGAAADTEDLQCGGTAAENNVWGEGKLDVLTAVQQAPRGPLGTVAGTVTGADGAPLPSAEVHLEGGARTLHAATSADGSYTITRVPVGEYAFTATSFGYSTVRRTVTVTEDQATEASAVLDVVPRHDVEGQVGDDHGRAVAGARVVVQGTPLPALSTDAQGRFALPGLPEGDYVLQVTPNACLTPAAVELHVDGPEQAAVTVQTRRDDYGHGCHVGTAEWVDGVTPLGVTGSQGARWVELPFRFTFYGASYDRVVVAANGLLSFAGLPGTQDPSFFLPVPLPIPFEFIPDAAIYPFWDDLVVDSEAGVFARTAGTAPNRSYVVEWRNVIVGNDGVDRRVSFETLLHEDGTITVQYRDLDNARERGSGAAVGIENADGTDGLQYSYRTATLPDDGAIEFGLGAHGTISGVVTDGNDGRPVEGARVEGIAGAVTRTTTTDSDGAYVLQLPTGQAAVRVSAGNYRESTADVELPDGARATVDAVLATGAAVADTAEVQALLLAGDGLQEQVTVTNTGNAPLTWSAAESGGARVGSSEEAGEVLRSWHAGGLTQAPQGIGLTGDTVWVSETMGFTAHTVEYTDDGVPTGRTVEYDWLPTSYYRWELGDMAYDAARGLMCQAVSRAGLPDGDGIHCWNPDTGEREEFIPALAPTYHWEDFELRGLAYRAETDTFFISDPRRTSILEVAGLSHPVPGTILHVCGHDEYPHGLAWDEQSGTLWLSNRTITDSIIAMDPQTCTVRERIDHPAQAHQGAGLDLDASGNLWTVGHADGRVYQLTSGSPLFTDVPWLSVSEAAAPLAPGETATLTVTANTSGLAPGVHEAEVWLRTDAGRAPQVRVPVRLTVTDYRVGVDVGGTTAYTDAAGETWAADRQWSGGGWGWTGTSAARSVKRPIAGTDDDALFATARTGAFSYRFSDLPDGRYELELGFAEIQRRAGGSRVFDVLAEGRRLAYALDPARAYGQDTAGLVTAVVDVTDGELDLTFAPRSGEPILNALRVTRVVAEE